MQKLDYSCMSWERIDPASLVGLTVSIEEITGVPNLTNGIVLCAKDHVFSIEPGDPGLEVYRAERKEVDN